MLRLIFGLVVFGGIAVVGLLYFDLIELTPEGQDLYNDAEEAVGDAIDGAAEAIENGASALQD